MPGDRASSPPCGGLGKVDDSWTPAGITVTGVKPPTGGFTPVMTRPVQGGAKPLLRASGNCELGVHSGGVVAGEVADQFILPGRQGHSHPA